MIFEIEISAQAKADLCGIYEYIAWELQSPENAGGQLDRLEKHILKLDQQPERLRQYEQSPAGCASGPLHPTGAVAQPRAPYYAGRQLLCALYS